QPLRIRFGVFGRQAHERPGVTKEGRGEGPPALEKRERVIDMPGTTLDCPDAVPSLRIMCEGNPHLQIISKRGHLAPLSIDQISLERGLPRAEGLERVFDPENVPLRLAALLGALLFIGADRLLLAFEPLD